MTWTYAGPQAGNLGIVRYLVADTDPTEPLAMDEEILWQLSQQTNVRLAAAEVASQIALFFARQGTVRRGDTLVEYGQRAAQYAALATQLRREAALRVGVPYAGGISVDDKRAQAADTDRVRPAFTRALHAMQPAGRHGEAS
jgi:hypothetical protein